MPLKLIQPGKRHKASKNWYVRGTIGGQSVDESTGTENKAFAEAYRIRRENELLDRHIHGDKAPRYFAVAAELYLNAHQLPPRDVGYVVRLAEHFGDTRTLDSIDAIAIDGAVKALCPRGAPATINRTVLGPLAAILHHAGDTRRIERRRPPKGRTRWLTYAEADRLLEACRYKDRAPETTIAPLVEFLFYTGCRIGEALSLDWAQVNLAQRHIVFLDTKNGDDRGVPLHPRAFTVLANLSHRAGAVFRRPDGKPYAAKSDGGGQIKTAWAAACRRAGMATAGRVYRDSTGRERTRWKPAISPHTCRHTWATWFYAETRDVRALMELGGWKTLSQVQRYTHVNKEHLRPSIERLGENSGIALAPNEKSKYKSA